MFPRAAVTVAACADFVVEGAVDLVLLGAEDGGEVISHAGECWGRMRECVGIVVLCSSTIDRNRSSTSMSGIVEYLLPKRIIDGLNLFSRRIAKKWLTNQAWHMFLSSSVHALMPHSHLYQISSQSISKTYGKYRHRYGVAERHMFSVKAILRMHYRTQKPTVHMLYSVCLQLNGSVVASFPLLY